LLSRAVFGTEMHPMKKIVSQITSLPFTAGVRAAATH
jgi:hypothetical protein